MLHHLEYRCPTGTYLQAPCKRTSDTVCASCTECGADEYETRYSVQCEMGNLQLGNNPNNAVNAGVDVTEDRDCAAYSASVPHCAKGRTRPNSVTLVQEVTKCEACHVNAAGTAGHFCDRNAGGVCDTCTNCTDCSALGQYYQANCTGASDSACGDCIADGGHSQY